ncbi:hypothetical protein D3C87_1325940 [compost metagenome]
MHQLINEDPHTYLINCLLQGKGYDANKIIMTYDINPLIILNTILCSLFIPYDTKIEVFTEAMELLKYKIQDDYNNTIVLNRTQLAPGDTYDPSKILNIGCLNDVGITEILSLFQHVYGITLILR